MLEFHKERKNISTLAATETVVYLFVGNNMEAGGFFFVKWAESLIAVAGRIQSYMLADDLDDIGSLANQRYYFGRNKAQKKPRVKRT